MKEKPSLEQCISSFEREHRIPDLDRKIVLRYLLTYLGSLTRKQIETLSNKLYEDLNKPDGEKRIRVVAEVCKDAGLHNQKISFKEDEFLNSVALIYNKTEMETQLTIETLTEYGRLVDALAGAGPPRPLMKEFYSLQGLGEVVIEEHNGIETFFPTNRGIAHSRPLKEIFENLGPLLREERFLLGVGRRWHTEILSVKPQ